MAPWWLIRIPRVDFSWTWTPLHSWGHISRFSTVLCLSWDYLPQHYFHLLSLFFPPISWWWDWGDKLCRQGIEVWYSGVPGFCNGEKRWLVYVKIDASVVFDQCVCLYGNGPANVNVWASWMFTLGCKVHGTVYLTEMSNNIICRLVLNGLGLCRSVWLIDVDRQTWYFMPDEGGLSESDPSSTRRDTSVRLQAFGSWTGLASSPDSQGEMSGNRNAFLILMSVCTPSQHMSLCRNWNWGGLGGLTGRTDQVD